MASLAQYLLRLAEDPKFAEKHGKSELDAKAQMTEFKLTEHQQSLLLEANPEKISRAVADEFPTGLTGTPVILTITCMIVKHVTD